jgi:hypothetical protein
MEAGAAFLLLLIVVIVAIVGGGLWAVVSTLRRRKLNPTQDKVDRQLFDSSANGEPSGDASADPSRAAGGQPSSGAAAGADAPPADEETERPEHHRVGSEQSTRSIPRR